jgi:hypothetical protein
MGASHGDGAVLVVAQLFGAITGGGEGITGKLMGDPGDDKNIEPWPLELVKKSVDIYGPTNL